jgi:hypothetical protein
VLGAMSTTRRDSLLLLCLEAEAPAAAKVALAGAAR